MQKHGVSSTERYCPNKLANILYTKELAKRCPVTTMPVNPADAITEVQLTVDWQGSCAYGPRLSSLARVFEGRSTSRPLVLSCAQDCREPLCPFHRDRIVLGYDCFNISLRPGVGVDKSELFTMVIRQNQFYDLDGRVRRDRARSL